MLQWLRKPSDDPDATEQPSANDPYDLRGQAAVVTGSTSGIGQGLARALAMRGCDVVLNGLGDPAEI